MTTDTYTDNNNDNNDASNAQTLRNFDKSTMFDVLTNFPNQVREATLIGVQAPYFAGEARFNLLVFAGMGGSAIAGDLLRCTMQGYAVQQFATIVNRSYEIPAGTNAQTAVILSSYSGNTEETLAAYNAAQVLTKQLLCISTGGELSRRAERDGVPCIQIPDGLQPRCAVAYSFLPVLITLLLHGNVAPELRASLLGTIEHLPEFLETKAADYAKPDAASNPAYALAERLQGTIPVFYSSPVMEAVNLRWRGQMQENAKHLAFGNIVPEMNHNEINGWVLPDDLQKRFTAVFLRNRSNKHQRVDTRFEAMKNILQPKVHEVIELHAEGDTLLMEMFSLLYLADWTTYWLALLNGQDPSTIDDITALKTYMTAHGA
jgi:glucose/mannose-6-phosphate isomerase